MMVTFLINNTFELDFLIKKWNPAVAGFHRYRFSPCADGDFADTGMRLGKLIFGGICKFLGGFEKKPYFCGEKLNV